MIVEKPLQNERFESFCANRQYRRTKRSLFNSLLRRRKVAPFMPFTRCTGTPILDVGCSIAPMVRNGPNLLLSDMAFEFM
jgi:hypothetical protein